MTTWLSTVFQSMARPFKWWVTVASWEQGLRVRLGKRCVVLRPGIHLRIPFLDRVYVQSTRARVVHVCNQSLSTVDRHVVTLTISIRYEVLDILTLYERAAAPEMVLTFEAMRAASGIVSRTELPNLNPAELEREINAALRRVAIGLCGMEAAVTQFCVSRCLRIISGDGWMPTGRSLDEKEHSGEVA